MTEHSEILSHEEELSKEFLDSIFEWGPKITEEQLRRIEKNMTS